jgi:hypothetical protein
LAHRAAVDGRYPLRDLLRHEMVKYKANRFTTLKAFVSAFHS